MRAVATTICVAALLVLTGGCRPIQVQSGYDATADLSARRTYAWRSDPNLNTGDPRFDNPQMETQIRRVVESELGAKGFERVSGGDPGFLIECVGGVGSGSSTVTRRLYSYDNVQDWRWTGSNTVAYEKGVVMLEMTDPATGRSLWRAAASAVLRKQADAAKRREGLAKLLRKMLADFPPKP